MLPKGRKIEMQKRISQSQWDEWKESEVTIHFFEFLQQEANALRQAAGVGAFIGGSILETGQNYANAITRAGVYELINSMTLDDTLEEEIHENSSRGTQDID